MPGVRVGVDAAVSLERMSEIPGPRGKGSGRIQEGLVPPHTPRSTHHSA